jgi:hypothetical protein
MMWLDQKSNNSGDGIGKDILRLSRSRHMKNLNLPKRNTVSNKLKIDLDLLGELVLNGVCGHVDYTD